MSVNIDPHNLNIIEFVSVQKTHKIKIEIDTARHEAMINDIQINFESPVELAMLLKFMCDELEKIHIKNIVQQVNEHDWDTILKNIKHFKLINKNDRYNFLNVGCEVKNFPEAFMLGLGFNPPNR